MIARGSDYVSPGERLARFRRARQILAELKAMEPWPVLLAAVVLAAVIAMSILAERAAHWRERAIEERFRAERCEALVKLPRRPARIVLAAEVADGQTE